jgi:Flp pilus assembly protein TadD
MQISEVTSAAKAFMNMQKADPADHRADLYLGYIAIQRNDVNEALLHYGSAIEKKPSSAEAYVAMADLHMQASRFKEAAALLTKAVGLGDNRSLVHYNRVLAFIRQSDMEQAESALKAALAEHPSDKNLLGLLDQWVEDAVGGDTDG